MVCSDAECDRPVLARGLCEKHYMREWRAGRLERLARHALHGRSQSAEHLAKRVASTGATLRQQRRTCPECGMTFVPTMAAQVYCSGRCWNAMSGRKRYRQESRRAASKPRQRVTKAEYDRLAGAFGDRCMICRRMNGKHRLAVDHNHATGEIRGLLCHRCNTALGLMRDEPELLEAAARYLRNKEAP